MCKCTEGRVYVCVFVGVRSKRSVPPFINRKTGCLHFGWICLTTIHMQKSVFSYNVSQQGVFLGGGERMSGRRQGKIKAKEKEMMNVRKYKRGRGEQIKEKEIREKRKTR